MQQNPNPPSPNQSGQFEEMLKDFQKKLDGLYTGFVNDFDQYLNMFDKFNADMAAKMGQTQVVIASLRKETAIYSCSSWRTLTKLTNAAPLITLQLRYLRLGSRGSLCVLRLPGSIAAGSFALSLDDELTDACFFE